jgi:hypothetical protein
MLLYAMKKYPYSSQTREPKECFVVYTREIATSWPEIERVDLWAQNLKNSKWRFDSIRGAIAEYTRPLLNTSLVIITGVQ